MPTGRILSDALPNYKNLVKKALPAKIIKKNLCASHNK